MRIGPEAKGGIISIHALLAESDNKWEHTCPDDSISIHALLAESDRAFPFSAARRSLFQSTLSLRRATLGPMQIIYTTVISIHALLAESDLDSQTLLFVAKDFNPRSPCGERPDPSELGVGESLFQSTLSLRRATLSLLTSVAGLPISIHALLAESDDTGLSPEEIIELISIHALLAESDGNTRTGNALPERFQSTLSLRRATPRSHFSQSFLSLFQSTLSLRRATGNPGDRYPGADISIHALLAESDFSFRSKYRVCNRFQSTLSLRRATLVRLGGSTGRAISIHALLAESDCQ